MTETLQGRQINWITAMRYQELEMRVLAALECKRRWLDGKASDSERAAAGAAAWAAAWEKQAAKLDEMLLALAPVGETV